jgi:ABC-type glycerol-3-phosphate transport system substrate-binding protein
MSMIIRLVGALVLLLATSAAQAQNKVPSERALEALVKASLLSFNDANITGNYTVFRDKLSKPFRDQFSPERLKETFKDFNQKHIDIEVVAAFKPTYVAPPTIDAEGKLQVKGYFPTDPVRVNFELDFIPSDTEWKLVLIHVKLGDSP